MRCSSRGAAGGSILSQWKDSAPQGHPPSMSTFYLLPPRAVVGDRLADALTALIPGVGFDAAGRSRLAEILLETLAARDDVYLVPRDDLTPGVAPEIALIDGYGASAGDEVVEVRPAARPGEFASRRWRISCCPADPSA